MSLRFDVDWQGGEIEKTKDGEYLLSEDVKKVLLDLKEIYYEDAELINEIMEQLELI